MLRNIAVDCEKWLDLEKELKQIAVEFKGNLVNQGPLFMNRQNEDFRLRPDSPAFDKGFRQIPLENIGRSAASP